VRYEFPGDYAYDLEQEVEKTVKNIHEVLKQKEADCAQLRYEIEALRLVIPLLDEKAANEQSAVADEGRAERASLLNEEAQQVEPSMRTAEEREVREDEAAAPTEIDVDRKGPLSASVNETSWWKRQGKR
jgi:hypothetical protein